MKRIYFSLLIFCCGLYAACTSSNIDFPHEETLAFELMPLQGVTLPYRLEVKHPFLIVQNLERTDSLFHIYDLNSYELKCAFGFKGRGPNEFFTPYLFSTQLPDIIIDRGDDLVSLYYITLEGMPMLKGKKQPLYPDGMLDAAFINDTLFVRNDLYISPELQLFTFHDELPRKTWTYGNPNIRYRWIDSDFGKVYANEERIVFCYHFKKQIDFMDVDFNLINRVKFTYPHPIHVSAEDEYDVKRSYTFGYCGNRYLYIVLPIC